MSVCANLRSRFSTYLLSAVSGLLMLIIGFTSTVASASLPSKRPSSFTSIALAPNGGFWIQVDNGADFSYTLAVNGAPQYANVPQPGTIISIPGTFNYWVVTLDGRIYARGGAPPLCGGNPGKLSNCSGFKPSKEIITGAAASPNGTGLWAVDEYRHVWTAGSTVSYGDVTSDNRTPAGMAATPSGRGYYVVMNDGGVFSFGDAQFYGSTGGKKPGGHDISGIALSFDLQGKQNGYWLVTDDGGIHCFGDAPFLGSTGGNDGGRYVTNIVARPDLHAYAWVHADGRFEVSRAIRTVKIQLLRTVPTDAGATSSLGVWGVNSDSIDAIYNQPESRSTSQQWDLWPTTDDSQVVQIINVSSGLCADVANGAGPNIIQYPCKGRLDGWDNQRFRILTRTSGCAIGPTCVDFEPLTTPFEYVITGENSQLELGPFSGGFWKIISLDPGEPATETAIWGGQP
jgi:hypothetical protein